MEQIDSINENEEVVWDLQTGTKIVRKKDKRFDKVRIEGLRLDNYLDNVKAFYDTCPFFYDRNQCFWFWNRDRHCYEIVDETDILNALDRNLSFYGQTISSKVRQNYLEAFKRVGREKLPNEAPVKWVQFKFRAYSVTSLCEYDVLPNYLFTNPIPWDLGSSSETPTIDAYFQDWVGEQKTMLYELIAYCCYRAYPIESIFCLYGCGSNGKSTFLNILRKFLGDKNITATELDLLAGNSSSRFEPARLYKKLVCLMGETNFGTLEKSSILKKLCSGKDPVGMEMKNKNSFEAVNYAKIIIASNSLPTSRDDTDGFYRKWNIIRFDKQFPEGKDLMKDIPDIEFNNLARKCMDILPGLIKRGRFSNHTSIEERKKSYIMVSNPISIFIKENCVVGEKEFCSFSKLYTLYLKYLQQHKIRRIRSSEFKQSMLDEGFYIEKTSRKNQLTGEYDNGTFAIGLRISEKNCDNCDNYATNPTSFPTREKEVGNVAQTSQLSQIENAAIMLATRSLIDDVRVFCNQNHVDNYQKAVELFGEETIQLMLKHGEIFESPYGTLRCT